MFKLIWDVGKQFMGVRSQSGDNKKEDMSLMEDQKQITRIILELVLRLRFGAVARDNGSTRCAVKNTFVIKSAVTPKAAVTFDTITSSNVAPLQNDTDWAPCCIMERWYYGSEAVRVHLSRLLTTVSSRKQWRVTLWRKSFAIRSTFPSVLVRLQPGY